MKGCIRKLERVPPSSVPAGQFYGEKVRSKDVAGASLTEYRYTPGFVIPKHLHTVPYIAFVLQGTYTEDRGASRIACQPSSVLFQPAGAIHSEQHDAKIVRIFSLQFALQFICRIHDYVTVPSEPQLIRNPDLATVAHKLYREFVAGDPLAAIAAEGYALETLVTFCRHCQSNEGALPPWLATVRDIIHDQCPFVPSLAWMANEVNIHPAHISRVFRHHFRCTIGEYARKLRVERAKQLLVASEDCLSDVASAIGYSEQSHFSTMFKRRTGFSPGEFRKLFKQRTSRAKG